MTDSLVEQMSKMKDDVRRRMEKAVADIVFMCSAYGHLGKAFLFSSDHGLERRVNQRLASFGDEVIGDASERAKFLTGDDDEDAIAWMLREIDGKDAQERADGHSSVLRYFLEGWIAIGLAKGLSGTDVTANLFRYISNPYASPLWQEAVSDLGYMSASIRSRGYSYGKGNQRNVLNAMSLLAQNMVNMAVQKHTVNEYRNSGAIGYRTRRNSKWDCELCDEAASVIHPLTEIVLPVHPRCVCSSYPVYMTDLYPEDQWEHTYIDSNTDGYVVTNLRRKPPEGAHSNEKGKFDKESRMAKILAQNGFRVEYLEDVPGKSSCDIKLNGINADLKSVKSHNNIRRKYNYATQKQGAKIVVFEFTAETKEIHHELNKYHDKKFPLYYYFLGKDRVYKA